jgi:uncharacterized repeat protein (TIGR03803 family)
VLYAFPGEGGHGTAGANPLGGIIRDAKGDIHGVTEFGGVENEYGVVFKLSVTGKEAVLHTFAGPPKDGAEPVSSLLLGSSGMFYGTTAFGGSGECRGGPDCGIVFAIDSAGHYSIIHNFQGGPDDGIEPWGNLVQDAQGNIYGTTMGGGPEAGLCGPPYAFGCGTIFKLSANSDGGWTESILYNFTGAADGSDPVTLAIDAQGNLYGAALFGGSHGCVGGCGTVFKMDTGGDFTVLHSFTGGNGGMGPDSVLPDAAGNLYGSAIGGSPSCQSACGIVYKLDASQKFTVLHSFNGKDGDAPGYLILNEGTGILYGTTNLGGTSNWGTIFQLKP